MNDKPIASHRILVVDDNLAIHQDFRKIFVSASGGRGALDDEEALLFGETPAAPAHPVFEIDSAHQGQEALELVRHSLQEQRPYALAFMDVRMPPGWDGVETTAKIWEIDPDLQVVLCTAYSDYSWSQTLEKLGLTDRLVILKKPFDNIEVLQLAQALTAKWQLAEQAKGRMQDLERVVATRTRELTDAIRLAQESAAAATAASKAKSDFLANMSHEIRTPMNAIIGMTDLLCETSLTERQKECADIVRNSGVHLLTIINGILDFSKIEAGKLAIEQAPFDLRQCVEDSLDLVALAAAEKHLEVGYEIEAGTPLGVMGDSGRVRQVLANYLSNAVKFTREGEVLVKASARCLEGTRHEFTFAVKDSGVGIPADKQELLFRSFSQVDCSSTRAHGGTGLGLAISQRLSELMGGRAWMESAVGRGSTFSFSIVADAVQLPARSGETVALRGKRVLVVDDNANSRHILRSLLRSWGMEARDTASPREALAWIEAGEAFDLGLIDYLMPELDGVALARAIRAHRGSRELPMIMVSAAGRSELAGADFAGFAPKPIRHATLLELVQRVLCAPVASPQSAAPDRQLPAAASQPMRILVVEDNPINQKVAARMLESLGYRADLAQNGAQAVELVDQVGYDLVFMDVQMPVMDGLAAARLIREHQQGAHRPKIIAMTASALLGDREACLAAGMDDYVSKPVDRSRLAEVLEKAQAS